MVMPSHRECWFWLLPSPSLLMFFVGVTTSCIHRWDEGVDSWVGMLSGQDHEEQMVRLVVSTLVSTPEGRSSVEWWSAPESSPRKSICCVPTCWGFLTYDNRPLDGGLLIYDNYSKLGRRWAEFELGFGKCSSISQDAALQARKWQSTQSLASLVSNKMSLLYIIMLYFCIVVRNIWQNH